MIRDDDRPEVEAFVCGFGIAMRAAVGSLDAALFAYAVELARELYPPYPHAPTNNSKTFGTHK